MNPNAALFLCTPAALCLLAAAAAAQGPNRCASVNPNGACGNGNSHRPSLSADGRYVAFESAASDLVVGDTNGEQDVFVMDRTTGVVTRVSVASNGTQASAMSGEPAISADGRYVAFVSRSGLSPFDSNGLPDVYRHDRATGQTVLVSCSALGIVGQDGSGAPSISGDGRFVAFRSLAWNLVPNDTNGWSDVFVKDLQTGQIEIVSSAAPNVGGNLPAGVGRISRDGRFVAFDSYASNLVANDTNGTADVFVRDRQTGGLWRVSVGPNSQQGDGASDVLDITADGSLVLYRSWASSLVIGDTNGCCDLFVSTTTGALTERVSVATSGAQGIGNSMFGTISGDGRFVAMGTRADNLVPGDFNQYQDVVLRDRVAGITSRVSRSLGGGSLYSDCDLPVLEDNGRFVAYATASVNALAQPMFGSVQIVVTDTAPAVQATFQTFGQGCQGSVGVPSLDRHAESLPWTGTSLLLVGANAVGSTFGLQVFGFSASQWSGIPLPAPLAGFGMGGCSLYTSIDAQLAFGAQPNGTWNVALAVPRGAGWLGAVLHTQAWLFDPWANALGATVSNAATLVCGG